MTQHARIDRCIDFIAAAMQVPGFLIVRKGDRGLANPLYDKLLCNWLDAHADPTPAMNEFAFALASGLSADIHGDEQLAAAMAGRGYRTRSWVSSARIVTMIGWMQATPITHIAHLAACWRRLCDAEAAIDCGAPSARKEIADRRAALAWQVIQTGADGVSFRSAYAGALASQGTSAVVDGWCGHRPP